MSLLSFAYLSRLSIAVALSSLCAFASTLGASLNGIVTDKTDGGPLLGATVTVRPHDLSGRALAVATDKNGSYEVTNIAVGTYGVTVSFVGYSSEVLDLTIADDSDLIHRDVSLTPRAIDLQTISVTASRRPEKLNDAPAEVSVVGSESIQERTTLTPAEHVAVLPGVDIARAGLNQANMVTRGFNNIFSTALLVLVDNRMANVPSLRYNAYNFIPTVDEDIDRIEMVSGPGSALYGPNSAAGVMHIITKSPFVSEGTTVNVGGGERELRLGSFRHAGSYLNRIGYKLSGQFYEGNDWKHFEPSEPSRVAKFRPTASGPDTVGGIVSNSRNFRIRKLSGEGRADFLISDDMSLILNGGYNRSDGIELTGVGAAQARGWAYTFAQARLRYKDLFAQGYVNASDAGNTYLLNTGQLIVDHSRTWAAQIQHSYQPGERWSFVYGADANLTHPNTDYTINGRNEDNDNIDEIGAYVQGERRWSERLNLIGALRLDHHNRLEKLVLSPRGALVYQPDDNHSLRFTYNRAFATPDITNLFLDIMQARDPFGVGAGFEEALGFRPDINLRVFGVPETGFHWRMGESGPMFRSPFAPLDPRGLKTSDYIPFGDPVFTNVMWSAGRGAVISNLAASLANSGLDQAQIAAMLNAVGVVTPAGVTGVNDAMMTFNPDTRSFDPATANDISDIDPLEPAITQTFELGYKGVFSEQVRFSLDLYRTKKHNFVGPLTVETPNVFLDPNSLSGYLATQIQNGYESADSATQASLDQLDNTSLGGNNNGTPVDELTGMFTSGAARIPFGTVSPEESLDPTDLLVTYRNFGDVTLYGLDFSFAYHLNRNWDLGGCYSYVSRNFFPRKAGQVHDIYLNAPRNKFGLSLQYNQPRRTIEVQARLRYVDAFDMISPFVGSHVRSYILLDLTGGVDILEHTRLTITVQNVLDNRHVEFIGAPKLGRLAVARVTQSF